MRVQIVERDGEYARYFLFAEDGRELRQVHRAIIPELKLAKEKHLSLAAAIKRTEEKAGT